MGNFLAFASVTSTISYLLEEVNRDVSGIRITTRPLDAIDLQNPANGLNIFLYLVSPTNSLDAVDTLVRDKTGQPTNNPVLSLDLHYIITATSSENDDLVAQKILASAMRILNNHPILLKDLIRRAVRNKEGLESSDLADQIEDVRLTLNALSTDDLTKIWSRFPNANFRPSIVYMAQIVLLESKVVEPSGTIGSVALEKIGQLKSPSIDRLEPQALEYAPDASIVIVGNNLKAPGVTVEIGDAEIHAQIENITDNRIVAHIPNEVSPGILKVRISQYLRPINGSQILEEQSALKSNVSSLVLVPRILSPRQGKISRGMELKVDFEPSVSGRTIFVCLGDKAIPAVPVRIGESGSNSRINSVKLLIPSEIEKGVYLLRIGIDGALSFLVMDGNPRSSTFKKAIGPYIEVI